MKDIELPPLPDPKYIWHDADEPGEAELFEFEFSGAVDGRCDICERLYSGEQIQAYARAAVEADRAQRVPDAAAERERILGMLPRHNWSPSSIFRYYYPSVTGDWVDLRELRTLLASTPAQPAPQQERKPMTDGHETRVMKLMGVIDDLIKSDPDRAERLIESILARNALRKRLASRHHGIKE